VKSPFGLSLLLFFALSDVPRGRIRFLFILVTDIGQGNEGGWRKAEPIAFDFGNVFQAQARGRFRAQ